LLLDVAGSSGRCPVATASPSIGHQRLFHVSVRTIFGG
jgi:hypothetical protein